MLKAFEVTQEITLPEPHNLGPERALTHNYVLPCKLKAQKIMFVNIHQSLKISSNQIESAKQSTTTMYNNLKIPSLYLILQSECSETCFVLVCR